MKWKGTCCQDQVGSGPGQVWSSLGLFQVWFRLQLKFDSLELDSEVGQLVYYKVGSKTEKYHDYEVTTEQMGATGRVPLISCD